MSWNIACCNGKHRIAVGIYAVEFPGRNIIRCIGYIDVF